MQAAGQTFHLQIDPLLQGGQSMCHPAAWWCTRPFYWYEGTVTAADPKYQSGDFQELQCWEVDNRPLVGMYRPVSHNCFHVRFLLAFISDLILRGKRRHIKCVDKMS